MTRASAYTRLNIKRLAAGLPAVAEDEFQRIISDLEDGASISGSDSECVDEDDEDDDDDEFRGLCAHALKHAAAQCSTRSMCEQANRQAHETAMR
jgi:hypothetical protein